LLIEKVPKISVVMPLYNKQREVGRTLFSVLKQTMQDFELLIVNDGSTDGGPDVVRSVKDRRIRIIDQSNRGVSAARNKGIEEANCDVIAFLDADDEWEPDFLETVLHLRTKFPGCDVFATSYWFSNKEGSRRRPIIHNVPEDPWEGILNGYFTIAAKSDPPLWTSAVCVTKRAIASIGGFPVGIYSGEDLLTWARLAVNYEIAYANRPCAIHWNPESISDRPGRVPQRPDIVGNELIRLMNESPARRTRGIKEYIGLWHQMRAIIYFQLGDRKSSLDESKESALYRPSLKIYLLMLSLVVPVRPPARLLTALRKFTSVLKTWK